jgi:hypothetical protein
VEIPLGARHLFLQIRVFIPSLADLAAATYKINSGQEQ